LLFYPETVNNAESGHQNFLKPFTAQFSVLPFSKLVFSLRLWWLLLLCLNMTLNCISSTQIGQY